MEAYLGEKNKLENYLKGELYCREERQFAALLYSVFLRKKRNGKAKINKKAEGIIKDCLGISNEEYKIKDVYFEATLMRDYFCKGKKDEFNRRLLEFCMAGDGGLKEKDIEQPKTENGTSYNLGQKGAKQNIGKEDISEWLRDYIPKVISGEQTISEGDQMMIQKAKEKSLLDIAGMMMNATPDILVIYEKGGSTYAKALECKYTSDEGPYKDVAGVERKMQYFIQECIMLFLFGGKPDKPVDYHYPPCPQRGIWRTNENSEEKNRKKNVWKEIFLKMYKNIMEQEYAVGKIINAGVEVIRFVKSTGEGNKKQKEIKIEIKDLLDIIY